MLQLLCQSACVDNVTVADCMKANAAAVTCCAVKLSDIATAGYELPDLGCFLKRLGA